MTSLRSPRSPIMCLEHPLSRNHLFLESYETKATYTRSNSRCSLWYPHHLGSILVRRYYIIRNPNLFELLRIVCYETFIYWMTIPTTIMTCNASFWEIWFVKWFSLNISLIWSFYKNCFTWTCIEWIKFNSLLITKVSLSTKDHF